MGQSPEFFERKKNLAPSGRHGDIRKAFERAGADWFWANEASFECALLKIRGEHLIKPAWFKIVEKCVVRMQLTKWKLTRTLTILSKTELIKWLKIVKTSCTLNYETLPFHSTGQDDCAARVCPIYWKQWLETGHPYVNNFDNYYRRYYSCGFLFFMSQSPIGKLGHLLHGQGCSNDKGFNTCLKEKVQECTVFHCMLHRQTLAGK